jgi:hypothetical protein
MTHKLKISTLLFLGTAMVLFTGCFGDAATDAGSEDDTSSSQVENTDDEEKSSVSDDSVADTTDPEDTVSSSESEDVSSDTETETYDSSVDEVEESSVETETPEESSPAVEESSSSVEDVVESSSSVEVVESSEVAEGPERTDLYAKASKPDESDESWGTIMMGDLKLLNNKWGSVQTKCSDSDQSIFVNEDGSFGWTFSRGTCGHLNGPGDSPDYPEVEIGIPPFDKEPGSELGVSTSILLPLQIKDIKSASVTLDNYRIELTEENSWNLNFELWLSIGDPRETLTPDPELELMVFWGWNENRWGCDEKWKESGRVTTTDMTSNGKNYTLCHQDDGWGSKEKPWRYFQFRDNDGSPSSRKYTGKLDIQATLKWLVDNADVSDELWVTRFEVGTEIDDGTRGKVTIDDITYEVNGHERKPEFK